MVAINPFSLLHSLILYTRHSFIPEWFTHVYILMSSSVIFLQLRHVGNHNHLLLLLSFPKIFLPSYLYVSIFICNLLQMKNVKEELHPLSPFSSGWCLLPWLPPPFLCPSYSAFLPWLVPMSSLTSPSLPSCSCPLPYSSFLSLTLR